MKDSSDVCKVYDYKSLFEVHLKSQLTHLTEVRRVKFTKNDIKISLNLNSEPEHKIDLMKSEEKIEINELTKNLKLAYDDFLPIKKAKYLDIKKLLNHVILPKNATFYSDEYLKYRESETFCFNENSFCLCKGKCLKRCICKKNNQKCLESCYCEKHLCKNLL
jgi:hypothetical protein